MHGADIVAYQYNADTYCTGCILDVLPTGEGEEFDGWEDASHSMSVESNLREIAFAFSIDYDELASYDSDEFPKPVFASQVEEDEHCGECHDLIIE